MRAAAVLAALTVLVSGALAVAQEPAPTPASASGRALFVERCGLCHLEGGFGTRVLSRRVPEGQALLEQRQNLTAPFVTLVVRRGIGSMPQIRAAELSDADLALIAHYLETGA